MEVKLFIDWEEDTRRITDTNMLAKSWVDSL